MEANTLTVRDFRSNLSRTLDRADAGERVYVQRDCRRYILLAIGSDDLAITPKLQLRIDEAVENFRRGNGTTLRSHEEIDQYVDGLLT